MILVGDPCPGDDVIRRVAVKCIAVVDDRVLLLRAAGRDDLKFPGGGVEPGEDGEAALARELREECGFRLVTVTGHALDTQERRPALDRPGAVFEMVSRYWWCEVADDGLGQRLDDYERDLGLAPCWIAIDDAVASCTKALASGDFLAWTPRELAVLTWLQRA